MRPQIVIIGAGFGGLNAATRLGSLDADIVVIDRQNHHLFQPLLYQVATAGLSPAQIAAPIRSVLHGQKNTRVLLAEVNAVDRAKREVLTNRGAIHYDYLIVATGARQSYFGHDEWEPFATGLKSIEDATKIRRKILLAFENAETETDPLKREALLTFVVVGAGPTGVEVAGAIAELAHRVLLSDFRSINVHSTKVVLLEAGPRVLSSFPETLAKTSGDSLANLGVSVRTGARVEKVDADGVIVNGERIRSATVIWGAGVTASNAGKWLSAETDSVGRVIVKSDLSLPSHPEIFVIGDTANAKDDSGKPLPGLAPVAIQQGRFIAKLLRKEIKSKGERKAFHYIDKGMLATIGRSRAVAAIGALHLSGFAAWVLWSVVHIIYLIGFRNRIFVVLDWAWSYLTFQRGARLITKGETN